MKRNIKIKDIEIDEIFTGEVKKHGNGIKSLFLKDTLEKKSICYYT